MSFSTWIKENRSKAGLTQQELADLVGLSRSSVSNYERGGKNPDTGKDIEITEELVISFTRAFIREGLPVTYEDALKEAELIAPDAKIETNPEASDIMETISRAVLQYLESTGKGVFIEKDSERLENRTIVLGRKETLEGGITFGALTDLGRIVSGIRGEGLENAPKGLFALEVSSDQWFPLEQGKSYPAIRWEGKAIRTGDVVLFATSDGYDAKVYSQEADTEGLNEEMTFVVWADRAL